MRHMAVIPVALALAITLGCNRADDSAKNLENTRQTDDATGTAGLVEEHNRDFLTRAMDANMAEIELGRMAQSQAASAEVKSFAQMMVTDHGKALDELKPIASRTGTPMVGQLDEKHRDLRDKLAKLRGAEFDREYMQAMIDGHQDVVSMLGTRADKDHFGDNKGTITPEPTNDPVGMQINEWAAKTRPVAEHHLDEAKRIHDRLR